MTAVQIDRLNGQAREVATENQGALYRCNYCGVVYVAGAEPRILGFLDNGILGDGWHPRGIS